MTDERSSRLADVVNLDERNLERRVARAVVSLVRGHREAIQTHRGLIVTLLVNTKTGEIRQSYILAERE